MNLSRLFHCSIFSCSEKTAPKEQAGAARSTDRRETRGMSLICQYTIRSGVWNRECPWMRPVLQSGHGVAAARQGIGRATRIGPSDGSQVVAGWKKGRSEFLILASMTPNFSVPACMHPSPLAALALGPSGACQTYQSPTQPPGPRSGPPEGWAAVGLVSPASFFIQGVVGAFAQGFGLFSSDFGVGMSQDLGY